MTGIPTRPMELHCNGNCGAEFMGIEMESSHWESEFCFLNKFPHHVIRIKFTVINYKHNKSAVSAQQYQMNQQCTLAVTCSSVISFRLHTA